MPITEEEASKIKEQLLTQLDNFPEEKREQIKNQINSMTLEQVENFIKQNNLTHLGGQCIFCSIVANDVPCHKIAEDKNNLAILEINPEVRGHCLVIPKEHLDEIPESTKLLAQEVAKKIQRKLRPTEIEINELKIMEHSLLEVVPLYGEKKEKRKATKKELETLQKIITEPDEEIKTKMTIEKEEEEIPILLPRIP